MAKRLNGEGTIRRRPTCWELRVMNGYRADGKPSFRYFYGKTKKEVQEKLDEFKGRPSQRSGYEASLHLRRVEQYLVRAPQTQYRTHDSGELPVSP
jgi:hypothetical protein